MQFSLSLGRGYLLLPPPPRTPSTLISLVCTSPAGGDGICLGAKNVAVDVVVRNVTCDRNYRQGMSIINGAPSQFTQWR